MKLASRHFSINISFNEWVVLVKGQSKLVIVKLRYCSTVVTNGNCDKTMTLFSKVMIDGKNGLRLLKNIRLPKLP